MSATAGRMASNGYLSRRLITPRGAAATRCVELMVVRASLCPSRVWMVQVELLPEGIAHPRGEERRAAVRSLATSNHELMAVEVDVLDSEREAFEQAKSGAVEKLAMRRNGGSSGSRRARTSRAERTAGR
jgi:hypothetical protein